MSLVPRKAWLVAVLVLVVAMKKLSLKRVTSFWLGQQGQVVWTATCSIIGSGFFLLMWLPFAPFITGKTLLAKTLARFVNVPFVIADATAITQVIMESSIVPIFVIILSVRDNKQTKLTVRDAFFFLIWQIECLFRLDILVKMWHL
jgi:hypothetical protein